MRTFEVNRGDGTVLVVDLGDEHELIEAFDLMVIGQKYHEKRCAEATEEAQALRNALAEAVEEIKSYMKREQDEDVAYDSGKRVYRFEQVMSKEPSLWLKERNKVARLAASTLRRLRDILGSAGSVRADVDVIISKLEERDWYV